MSRPRNTRIGTDAGQSSALTHAASVVSGGHSSLLFVSTAGRGAASLEAAPAFFTAAQCGEGEAQRLMQMQPGWAKPYQADTQHRTTLAKTGGPVPPKKRHPAFAGRRAGDAITGGVMSGVFQPRPGQSSIKSAVWQPF